jgi:iron complex transport system substrate-binding protein
MFKPALLLLAIGVAAEARPPRIVSINPCVDAVLMRVADPSEIVAISHYSKDPQATSIPLALARRFRATSGTAEEVVALRPDIVLAGGHVSPATIAALRRMRIHVVQFPVPQSVGESVMQVRAIASAAGYPARGEALAAAIMQAARTLPVRPVPALLWQGGGLVPGKGTLADDLMSRAGFRNMSAAYGLKQWDVLPLEYLIARPPRVLFTAGSASDRLTSHPAVRRLASSITVVRYPERLMTCGGPTILSAMAVLKQTRARLGR